MPYWDGIGPQVTQDLDRSPSARPLTQVIPPWLEHKCTVTPLQIDAEEYKARCLPGKGPCFTHEGDGSLKTTNIEPWLEPLDMTQEILLMDDTARDFTVRDPSTPFEITYLTYANAKIRYSNFNPETRCYDILIKAGEHEGGDISVGESPADMSLLSRSSFFGSSTPPAAVLAIPSAGQTSGTSGELPSLPLTHCFPWVPLDIVQQVKHDQLKPEHLVKLCNLELRVSKEPSQLTHLTVGPGGVLVGAKESSDICTSAFVKAIPTIATLTQIWLVYITIRVHATGNLTLNKALLILALVPYKSGHPMTLNSAAGSRTLTSRPAPSQVMGSRAPALNNNLPYLYPDQAFTSQLQGALQHGVKLGYDSPLQHDACLDVVNLPMDSNNVHHLCHEIETRLAEGCLRHVTDPVSMRLVCLPVGVVPKPHSDKRRTIYDLSHPREPGTRLSSINDGINTSFVTIHYESLDMIMDFIHEHPSASLWKADLEDAFRHVIVAESDARLMGIHFDAFTLQAASPSPTSHSDMSHYLDDFFGASDTTASPATPIQVFSLSAAVLGFKLSHKKMVWDTTKLEILGIELDSVAQTASITQQ
ncbi:uncharacterized protein UBRO2_05955 [Ustilago bromivora]|uniref:Reverse transcriptase domain-containing protein n=1 Tax=Ustilago bromivora TaxID=307758 RepID=A0A8H8TWH0_9BASI|nr:uncharacterized protein UBRO2_05955 [Ustilago bromivora]